MSRALLGSQTDAVMCVITTKEVYHADIDVVVVSVCVRAGVHVCWGGQILSTSDTNQVVCQSF